MRKVLKLLDRFEEVFIASLMAIATLIIFISVTHRYASSLPIPYVQDWLVKLNLSWTQELCIYLFIWMVKIGAAYGVRTGIHVGVDVLINRLSDNLRTKFIIFGLLAGAFFTGIIGIYGSKFVSEMAQTGQTSPDMELPMWFVYLAIPIGSFLMCFRFLQACWNFTQTGRLAHYEYTKVRGIDAAASPALHPKDTSEEKKQ